MGWMRWIGKSMLEQTIGRFIEAKYPRMPGDIRQNVVPYYTGDESLEKVSRNVGMQRILHPTVDRVHACFLLDNIFPGRGTSTDYPLITGTHEPYPREKRTVFMTFCVFDDQGISAYLKFVERYFGVRRFSWEDVIDASQARLQYNAILKEQNKEPLTMRLLNESGRQSPLPTFVVGAFSGLEKHGEGKRQMQ